MQITSSNLVNSGASAGVATANERLSSGSRINSAADDAAGLQISDRLTSEINGSQQAIANLFNGDSMLQIASGGLSQLTDSLQQLRELGVQSGNGALNSNDRQALQAQANSILEGIGDTLRDTTFGGEPLLTEDGTLSFQNGPNAGNTSEVSTYDVGAQLTTAGVFAVDFTDPAALSTALDAIDASIASVGGIQAEYGAQQNAFSSRIDSLLSGQANEASARSRIQDTDFAATISDRIAQSILEQSSLSVQAQANLSNNRALSLLTQ